LICGVVGLAACAGHLAASPIRERRVTMRTAAQLVGAAHGERLTT
jgi:hypothetical protein